MRTSTFVPCLLLLAASACRQQVVVYECVDASHADAADAGSTTMDSGGLDAEPMDSGPADVGPGDSGQPIDSGACDPFCFTGVDVSASVVDVGEFATLTPIVNAANGVQWTVRLDLSEVVAERPVGRPVFATGDAEVLLETTGSSAAQFRVFNVAPWFFETRFIITVHVREVGRAVEQSQTVEVVVRGNVLMSTGAEGRIYAMGSDGLPATGGGVYANGTLISQFVQAPRSMVLSRDGSLLVHDESMNLPRIKRFTLTGADVLADELEYTDGSQNSLFRFGSTTYAMAELPDGSVVFPEYAFSGPSGAPKSRLMVWDANGSFVREVWAPSPEEDWRTAATAPNGHLVVVDREGRSATRYDPSTWQPAGLILDQLSGTPYGLHGTDDALYIGGSNYLLEASWAGGGRAAVSGLPGSSFIWRGMTGYEGGRLLCARDSQTDDTNIALIEDRQFVRWFRKPGGPVTTPFSLVYLH